MDGKYNIHLGDFFDKNYLRVNIDFIAIYTIVFEELRRFILDKPLWFFADEYHFSDGTLHPIENKSYKEKVLALHKKDRFMASLQWFKNMGALSESEAETVVKARTSRGEFIHNTINSILKGISPEENGKIFAEILGIYFTLDQWWIENIELPSMDVEDQKNLDFKEGFSLRAYFVKALVDMLLLGKEESYNWLSKKLKEIYK